MVKKASRYIIVLSLSYFDYSLFTKVSGSYITSVLLYVDDMIITGNDDTTTNDLKQFLNQRSRIKDHEPLKYFLRIKVASFKSRIFIDQGKYTLDILLAVIIPKILHDTDE